MKGGASGWGDCACGIAPLQGKRGGQETEPTFCGQRPVPTLEKTSEGYGGSYAKEKRGPKEASWGQEVVEQPQGKVN